MDSRQRWWSQGSWFLGTSCSTLKWCKRVSEVLAYISRGWQWRELKVNFLGKSDEIFNCWMENGVIQCVVCPPRGLPSRAHWANQPSATCEEVVLVFWSSISVKGKVDKDFLTHLYDLLSGARQAQPVRP